MALHTSNHRDYILYIIYYILYIIYYILYHHGFVVSFDILEWVVGIIAQTILVVAKTIKTKKNNPIIKIDYHEKVYLM